MTRLSISIAFGIALSLGAAAAHAQPKTPAPPPPPTTQSDAESPKVRAGAALARGVKLFGEQAWDAALAEFLLSRSLYPARGNTLNAAICLKKLQRYDEALDMMEALLREFPGDIGESELVEKEAAEIRTRVGSLDVRDAPPGTTVLVDARPRGATPFAALIRVSAGTHLVRLVKEGFAPFEIRVEVAGEQRVVVNGHLQGLTRSGRLKVIEQSGKHADVVVDDIVVGPAPWEGPEALGSHTVVLRGDGDLGTQPAAATVKEDAVSTLALSLEPLTCAVRIVPVPIGAAVALDRMSLGNGVWEGRLRCGTHRIEAGADGFLNVERAVTLVEGTKPTIDIQLDRDPTSAQFRSSNPPRITFDLTLAALLAPGFGGDADTACTAGCSQGTPFGGMATLFGGYQFSSGIGLGLSAGYARLQSKTQNRTSAATLIPSGTGIVGTDDDSRVLQAGLLGAAAWLRRGSTVRFIARLGGGVALGAMSIDRTSTLGGVSASVPRVDASASYAFVSPEVRVGYRVSEHFELNVGVEALVLFALRAPSFSLTDPLYRSDLGFINYQSQSMTGNVVLVLAPGLGASYAF